MEIAMANWYGKARTNYVRLADGVTLESLGEHLGLIGLNIDVEQSSELSEKNGGCYVGFFPSDDGDDGGFPSWLYPEIPDREEDPEGFAQLAKALGIDEDDLDGTEEAEFSWVDHVMPFVAEGQVLVVQTIGSEKLRYLTGYTEAFVRRGDEVKFTGLSIEDIYEKAAQEFGVDQAEIASATY
jgi:NACalpha-BTF3-like transcription factor